MKETGKYLDRTLYQYGKDLEEIQNRGQPGGNIFGADRKQSAESTDR